MPSLRSVSLIAALCLAATAAAARPLLVVDVDSGRVLKAEDATVPWYPASLTKLMTVYVVLDAVRSGRITMDTPLPMSARAASQAPSKMGFPAGTLITVDNALKMLLVKSANDIAFLLAEGVGGSVEGFVDQMNDKARKLGMTGSHFATPNGLPIRDGYDSQMVTARDLAVLSRALLREFPEQSELFGIRGIKVGKRTITNYNGLLGRYSGAFGMKTGFVCDSGFNLVAGAQRGNRRLLAIVLGASSGKARVEEAAAALEEGFNAGGIFAAVSAGGSVESLRNDGGAPRSLRAEVCKPRVARKGKKGKKGAETEVAAAPSEADGMAGDDDGKDGASPLAMFAGGAKPILADKPTPFVPVPVFIGPNPNNPASVAAAAAAVAKDSADDATRPITENAEVSAGKLLTPWPRPLPAKAAR